MTSSLIARGFALLTLLPLTACKGDADADVSCSRSTCPPAYRSASAGVRATSFSVLPARVLAPTWIGRSGEPVDGDALSVQLPCLGGANLAPDGAGGAWLVCGEHGPSRGFPDPHEVVSQDPAWLVRVDALGRVAERVAPELELPGLYTTFASREDGAIVIVAQPTVQRADRGAYPAQVYLRGADGAEQRFAMPDISYEYENVTLALLDDDSLRLATSVVVGGGRPSVSAIAAGEGVLWERPYFARSRDVWGGTPAYALYVDRYPRYGAALAGDGYAFITPIPADLADPDGAVVDGLVALDAHGDIAWAQPLNEPSTEYSQVAHVLAAGAGRLAISTASPGVSDDALAVRVFDEAGALRAAFTGEGASGLPTWTPAITVDAAGDVFALTRAPTDEAGVAVPVLCKLPAQDAEPACVALTLPRCAEDTEASFASSASEVQIISPAPGAVLIRAEVRCAVPEPVVVRYDF